ncbi:Hypp5296 [Branchiostoma lanceolatum]|uniref:Hypp5296 protein n=1 Tax=Branchiostoma lanceolatum TaxID=7740 RepID=A0A8K0AF31_BRALA|nr:Hypp5296 [Branchiostoma lanceolatum]
MKRSNKGTQMSSSTVRDSQSEDRYYTTKLQSEEVYRLNMDMIGLRARCRDMETRLEDLGLVLQRYRDQRDSLQRTSEVYRLNRDGDRAELRRIRWDNFDLKRENDALKSIISNMRTKQYYFGNALHGGPSQLEMLYCPPSTLLPYHSRYERPLSATAGEDLKVFS